MPTTKKPKRQTTARTEPPAEKDAAEAPKTQLKRNSNNLLIILLIIISLFAGYNFAKVKNLEKTGTTDATQQAQAQQPPARPTELKITKPDLNKEHVRGNKNARYVWVDYSDYECPFCKQIHPNLVKLMDEKKDIAWVFRHFPLPFHPKAEPSAEAAECVTELGGNDAFWKFTDMVYDKMPSIETSAYPDLVAQIGLDQTAFKQCVDSQKYEKLVKDSVTEGTNAGVQATPTGVIYDMKTGKNKLVEGALPYESLKKEVEDFIAANK